MDCLSDSRIPCPLCTAWTDTLVPHSSQEGPYMHCAVCDLVFARPEALPSIDEERVRYLEHDNTHDNVGYVAMFQTFLDQAVWPWIQGGRALEFGCGPGPVLADLLEQGGFSVVAYDPLFAPETQRRLQEESYDLITSTEVFEHIHELGQTIDWLLTLLKPGGVLAIMTHLHPGPASFADWWYHRDPTHVVFLSEQTVQWMVNEWPLELLFCDGVKTFVFRKTLEPA